MILGGKTMGQSTESDTSSAVRTSVCLRPSPRSVSLR
ncbi:unnamed protein product [Callosobruchus maculatus]|uniref:Uncharacterized protein n=1 Tax=Callosobruchus maculatus TaxID=64391 RepID=A0A653D720_CALMS|nr:unnamed protein product [Callosobruchus maculatus]